LQGESNSTQTKEETKKESKFTGKVKAKKHSQQKQKRVRGVSTRVKLTEKDLKKQLSRVQKNRNMWMTSGPEGSLQGETS